MIWNDILHAERRMRHETSGMYEGMEIYTQNTFSIWLNVIRVWLNREEHVKSFISYKSFGWYVVFSVGI